jgi:hypothetical protein
MQGELLDRLRQANDYSVDQARENAALALKVQKLQQELATSQHLAANGMGGLNVPASPATSTRSARRDNARVRRANKNGGAATPMAHTPMQTPRMGTVTRGGGMAQTPMGGAMGGGMNGMGMGGMMMVRAAAKSEERLPK